MGGRSGWVGPRDGARRRWRDDVARRPRRTWLMSRTPAALDPAPSPPLACAVRRRSVSSFFWRSSSSCFSRLGVRRLDGVLAVSPWSLVLPLFQPSSPSRPCQSIYSPPRTPPPNPPNLLRALVVGVVTAQLLARQPVGDLVKGLGARILLLLGAFGGGVWGGWVSQPAAYPTRIQLPHRQQPAASKLRTCTLRRRRQRPPRPPPSGCMRSCQSRGGPTPS
jgi:hypothetical protein